MWTRRQAFWYLNWSFGNESTDSWICMPKTLSVCIKRKQNSPETTWVSIHQGLKIGTFIMWNFMQLLERMPLAVMGEIWRTVRKAATDVDEKNTALKCMIPGEKVSSPCTAAPVAAGNPEQWPEQARKAGAQNFSTVVSPTVTSLQIASTSTLGEVSSESPGDCTVNWSSQT